MDEKYAFVFTFIEAGGLLAPLAFILFHIVRQFIFIPVVLVCIIGGILFGSVFGTLYSLVGLTLLSAGSYFILKMFPNLNQKLLNLKQKWFGPGAVLTVGQIAVLRLVPFVHYQLLNVCLMERKPAFGDYLKSSFLANLPLAFFYTVFGEFISDFTPGMVMMILFGLFILFYTLREKVKIIKWREFFHQPS